MYIDALPEGHRDDVVAVEDQLGSNLFVLGGFLDRLVHQGLRINLPEFMSHDEVIEQVFDGGEAAPALLGGDEGIIRDPFLVGLCSGEVTVEHILIPMIGSQFVYFLVKFAFSDDGMQIELVHTCTCA